MKKLSVTLATVVVAIGLFAGGAFAAATWLSFTGDEQVEQADANIDEIMEILREEHDGKITAEEAVVRLQGRVDELESMNPSGLAKQNKELREQVAQLETQLGDSDSYVNHLEAELTRANEKAKSHANKTNAAVEEARSIGGE